MDANLDRIREGLRVIEEVARFLLDDAAIAGQLKAMRHEFGAMERSLQPRLLAARRAGADLGAFADTPQEVKRDDLVSLVSANAKRVEESLRVLEEFGKLPDMGVEPAAFKRARFALYDIEQALVSRLLRRERREKVRGLYVIVDPELARGRGGVEVAQAAIRGGARVIQLRDKKHDKGDILPVARRLKEVCAQAGALFIMNDHPDLALAADADGVHLGQHDLPTLEARRILPPDRIVGCSTALVEEALQAEREGADYIAVGTIFPTATKAVTRPAGLETLRRVKAAVSVPVVAIGGINESNAAEVARAGADAIAVISAVVSADHVEEAARRLALKFESGQA